MSEIKDMKNLNKEKIWFTLQFSDMYIYITITKPPFNIQ